MKELLLIVFLNSIVFIKNRVQFTCYILSKTNILFRMHPLKICNWFLTNIILKKFSIKDHHQKGIC